MPFTWVYLEVWAPFLPSFVALFKNTGLGLLGKRLHGVHPWEVTNDDVASNIRHMRGS